MATATFIHDGNAIDYTPGSDVSAGDVVVQGELVGVTKRDIPANTLGDKLLALGLPLGAGLLAFFAMARIFGLRELEELKSSLWARRST